MRYRKLICVLLVCFCCGIGVYHFLPKNIIMKVNDSTAYMSLEEMISKADLIITCDITDEGISEWDRARTGDTLKNIHTDVPIIPDEVLLESDGIVTEEISVRTYVGEIGNVMQISSSRPSLKEGEEVLLFLQKMEDGVYDILGLSQGKFTLSTINGKSVYTNGRDEIAADELSETIETISSEYADFEWPSDYYTPEEIEAMNNALFHINE